MQKNKEEKRESVSVKINLQIRWFTVGQQLNGISSYAAQATAKYVCEFWSHCVLCAFPLVLSCPNVIGSPTIHVNGRCKQGLTKPAACLSAELTSAWQLDRKKQPDFNWAGWLYGAQATQARHGNVEIYWWSD